jgi:hypothetical protein
MSVNDVIPLHPLLSRPFDNIVTTEELDEILRQQSDRTNTDELYEEQESKLDGKVVNTDDCNKLCDTAFAKTGLGFNSESITYDDYIRECASGFKYNDTCTDTFLKNKWELANHYYDQLISSLFKTYIPFYLSGKTNPNIEDPITAANTSNKCTQIGWPQRADDCWIDTYLYSIFMNDTISPIVSRLCDKIIDNKSPDTLEYKIVSSINMYLHLLKMKAQANSLRYTHYKKQIKFCICVFGKQFIYEKHDRFLQRGIGHLLGIQDSNSNNRYISGGTISDLSFLFKLLFEPNVTLIEHRDTVQYYNNSMSHVANSHTQSILFRPIQDLAKWIKSAAIASDDNKILQIAFHGAFRYVENINWNDIFYVTVNQDDDWALGSPTHYSLESICVSFSDHCHVYTICNNQWRKYDNQVVQHHQTNQLVGDAEITPVSKSTMINNIGKLMKMRDRRGTKIRFDLDLIYVRGFSARGGSYNIRKQRKTKRNKAKSGRRRTRA